MFWEGEGEEEKFSLYFRQNNANFKLEISVINTYKFKVWVFYFCFENKTKNFPPQNSTWLEKKRKKTSTA